MPVKMNSKYFPIFSGDLREQKAKGLDKLKRHKPIEQEHLKQIFDNYFIPHFDNDPKCLQLKVYFDIAYYIGKCGAEGLTALRKDGFEIKVNSKGIEYLELTYNEATKKISR